MNGWDDLIGRLTRRLEVDEELRLDVARELSCHLEDSAAEFRAAGESEAEAAASAVKALGDERDLAEQLWQANRSRIHLRGVLRWTARVTLLPAAVLVTLLLLAYLLGISGYVRAFSAGEGGRGGPGWPLGPLGELVCDPYVGVPLTADQRFLLEGAPDARTDLDKAKSIADRWPDNRIYYANYIAHLLDQPGFCRKQEQGTAERFDEVMLAQTLAALHKGERIDPSNAFYDAEAASLLIQASSTLREDPSATYDKLTRKGEIEPEEGFTIQITDPQRFQQGLEEFHRALGKPIWTTRSVEMLRLRLSALGAPTRLIQYLNRLTLWVTVPLPGLGDARELGKSLGAYARVLAADGKAGQGVQLLEDVRRLAARMGAQSGTFLIPLFVAQGMTTHALGCEELLYRDLGRSDQAARARQERMKGYDFFQDLFARPRPFGQAEAQANMGFLESLLTPSLPGYESHFTAVRVTERFVFAELAMFVLLAVLVVGGAVLVVTVVAEHLAVRRADRGVLLFVGWERMGKICLLAILVPLAVYAVYATLAAVCEARPGLTRGNVDRMVLEFVVVGSAILVTLGKMSYSAIRRRACELGLTAPAPVRWRDRPAGVAVAAILALLVVGYLAAWWAGYFHTRSFWFTDLTWKGLMDDLEDLRPPGGFVPPAVVGTLVVYGLWRLVAGLLRRREYKRFRRSLRRSLIPILAAAVIVLGVALGGLLAVGEGWAIRQTGTGMPMPDEIADSDYRLLKEHFVEMDRAFQAQDAAPGDKPRP